MMLVLTTQVRENYGAHDWDGHGEPPQYWKNKGGHEYKILNVPTGVDFQEVVDMARSGIERSDNYFQETVIDWTVEDDTYLSWFERSQMEFDGSIMYPEPTLEYSELNARYTDPAEYAEQFAEADACAYAC